MKSLVREDIRRALWIRGAFLDGRSAEDADVRNALELLRGYVGLERQIYTDAFGMRAAR